MTKLRRLSAVVLTMTAAALTCIAAPFEKTLRFTQPDGTAIVLWGRGDEFHAVFETLDGYTVCYDPKANAYFYAALSADGTELVASALQVGQGDPVTLGLDKHLRMSADRANELAKERFTRWDTTTRLSERWRAKKAATQAAESAAAQGTSLLAPPAYTTTGTKVGLCLLIDFSDAPASIPQANIVDFCNGDAYTGYGNNGSVKKYFQDVSNGLLTYTNIVTAYIRMAQPKTYYNDTTQDNGQQGNLLIRDAIAILKAQPNYATTIAPAFQNLTVDSYGRIDACNVFFAGGDSGVWSYGLWPHSWGLYQVGAQALTTGISVLNYQITDIGDSLELGTFCHENGHMLCDYPDLYDYGYDSSGGAGRFCLMGYGGSGHNPVQICAYLKRASGWATTIDLTVSSSLAASLSASGAGFNTFYRYAKPGTATEYYLIENRQKSGRDATFLPASGIAIWHVDERGDRDNQSLVYNTVHANFELTLMQADNLWHLQNDINYGDMYDLFYAGNTAAAYSNRFNDASSPSARWWNGDASQINFSDFSANGTTMTFTVQPSGLGIATPVQLPEGFLSLAYSQTLSAYGGTPPYTWTVVSGALPSGLTLSAAGVLSGTPTAAGTAVFNVQVVDAASAAAIAAMTLTVQMPRTLPFTETFENGGAIPDGWSQTYASGSNAWAFAAGGLNGSPATAHGGNYNARFSFRGYTAPETFLVSPVLDIESTAQSARLSFWHCMKDWQDDQDELFVYYKTAPGQPWTLLAQYTDNVPGWTQRVIDLPETSRTFFIAFKGVAYYGYGICIDDVSVAHVVAPYATWQSIWFTAEEFTAGGIAGDTDDPDADGIVNLLEYAWAMDPRTPDTTGFPGGGVTGQYLTLSYRQSKQATDLIFSPAACADLPLGDWQYDDITEIARTDSNTWWQVTVRHDVPVTNAPARFMRLEVRLPTD